jgi:hypothetical protein
MPAAEEMRRSDEQCRPPTGFDDVAEIPPLRNVPSAAPPKGLFSPCTLDPAVARAS